MCSALILSALFSLIGVAEIRGNGPENNVIPPVSSIGSEAPGRRDLDESPAPPHAPGDRILEMIPESETGTGYPEWIEYQLPAEYDPSGSGHPLVVCWHGYNQSCMSVAIQSLIDEECLSRGWFYLSITGFCEAHFGSLLAQTHCTVAIRHLIDSLGFNVDTDRIYMAGLDMGAFGAADYASRHLFAADGYTVAGLVLVAPWYDLTDLYHQDTAIQPVLIQMMGGTPEEAPFAYQQLSTLFIENNTYARERSLGQNLRHNAPVWISYAGNHPLAFVTVQNEIFSQMLCDINANVVIDYHPVSATPVSWALLDESAALDFMAPYSLQTQQTDSLNVVADRDAWFYWMKPDLIETDTFSLLQGSIDSDTNTLKIEEATHTDALSVDCEGRLDAGQRLLIEFDSTYGSDQSLNLQSLSSPPTYVVDAQGKLYPDWTYGAVGLTIHCPAFPALELKASFEAYDLWLVAVPEVVKKNESLALHMGGGDPEDLAALFISIDQVETKVGMHHLLVSPLFPTLIWIYSLNASGEQSFIIPAVGPELVGLTFYLQFLTYENGIKELSNMAPVQVID
ncbi:MAG: hypothetical protein ABIK28_21150 [Planctomycetota bacterium]